MLNKTMLMVMKNDDIGDGGDDGERGSSRQEHSTRFKGSSQRSHTLTIPHLTIQSVNTNTNNTTVAQYKHLQYPHLQYHGRQSGGAIHNTNTWSLILSAIPQYIGAICNTHNTCNTTFDAIVAR